MKPSFDIDIVERAGAVILVLDGEIDLATASLLEEKLRAVEAQEAADVIIDLDRVSFMDSTGLQVLVAHTLSKQNGRRVRLTQGSPQVQRLFEVSGLRDHLPFVTPN
jgi:anti-sigma B factor antagonist